MIFDWSALVLVGLCLLAGLLGQHRYLRHKEIMAGKRGADE